MTGKFSGLALAVETPARMVIVSPIDGNPLRAADGTEAWIDLLAASGSIGRQHDRERIDRLTRQQARVVTAEAAETDLNDKLAKLTKGWFLVGFDGEPIDVPCTRENARDLYQEPDFAWLRDQAIGFANNLGNFPPAVSKN